MRTGWLPNRHFLTSGHPRWDALTTSFPSRDWLTAFLFLFLFLSFSVVFLTHLVTFGGTNPAMARLLTVNLHLPSLNLFVSNKMCILCKTPFVVSVLGLQSVPAVCYQFSRFFLAHTHTHTHIHTRHRSHTHTPTQILYKGFYEWKQYFIYI